MKKLLLLFLAFGLLQGYARQRFLEANFKNQYCSPFSSTAFCPHNTGLKMAGNFQVIFPNCTPQSLAGNPQTCGARNSERGNPGTKPIARTATRNKINNRYIAPIPFDKMPGDPERTQNPGF